ncbi:2OG-Fe(II) oxygenase [Paraburkholderia dinghuensis]|uniref:Proline hydroxylase n=1 Tax=Paraburkholderia dinghuensis TaxID=2305225 RepID=A0A3N6MU34_9BURK|nr:2OG-Fe(II) oxygenase [Paraburkholderia dinghuensis]RQH05415.1 proline hydroxylase [Paraburkholderia dinghuensis]
MPLTALRPDTRAASSREFAARLDAQLWSAIENDLDQRGYALIPGLLDDAECDALASLYERDAPFRSRVVMAHHGFGSGEYRYFAYPLPETVAELRTLLYARLVALANRWADWLGTGVDFPPTHDAFIARCHEAGQTRPTPLLLRYGCHDYNCLHQDLYGEHVFPVQATILLSAPGADFRGGEFVLTEQRARQQSRVEVVPLGKGDAVLFAVRHRPLQGARGAARAMLRHGVSRIREGQRYTLGVVLHDAS